MNEDNEKTQEIEPGAAEILRVLMTQRIRDDSRDAAKLTALESLIDLAPGATLEDIEAGLEAMGADEQCKDIRKIAASSGAVYLYSEDHITSGYANILARAEAGNPVGTIVNTVRDESRIYPRPTNVGIFFEEVFGIDPDDVGAYVEQVLKGEKYQDIELIEAPTGALYLFSNLYLDGDWAKALVNYEEVERVQNP